MNTINWTRKAVKQLLKLHTQHQVQIRDAVTLLGAMPDVTNVKVLTCHEYGYRLRAGNYRVLFDWDGAVKIVSIQEVKNVMNAPTDVQIINGPDGKPAFVVIPYSQYVAQNHGDNDLIPHDVVSRIVDGSSPIRAWREHLSLTQEDVAKRLGISQPAYAQQESVSRPRKATREKIAAAFGIKADQLEL